MSKINRIRIMNLNYNGNTIRIDDETFDLGGETTLLSLRNGGGKTVFVQMIMSLFVHKSHRDFENRPFRSYFTTNQPTFIMTEWKLDNDQGYFLAGMMVRKAQNIEDDREEDLEVIQFTGSYKTQCAYDIRNLPVIDEENGVRVLKTFGSCKKIFEDLKKDAAGDFRFFDMASPYSARQYFSKLKEYQIDYKEWETIIEKINQKESGLSDLFANAKDERGLVDNWFLNTIQNKLNQEQDRIKNFQELAYKMVQDYKLHEVNIRRKGVIEKFFEDADGMEKQILEYEAAQDAWELQKSRIAAFSEEIHKLVDSLQQDIRTKKEEVEALSEAAQGILHEKLSFGIYQLEDEKAAQVEKRVDSEMEIHKSRTQRERLEKEWHRFACARLYQEAKDFHNQMTVLQEKIDVLSKEQKDSEEERAELGAWLCRYYKNTLDDRKQKEQSLDEEIQTGEAKRQDYQLKQADSQKQIALFSQKIGGYEAEIRAFDSVEDRFFKKYQPSIQRNILGEYENGVLELYKKKIEDETIEENTRLTRLAETMTALQEEKEKLEHRCEELRIEEERGKAKLEKDSELLQEMEEEKNSRIAIMRFLDAPDSELDKKPALLVRLEERIKQLEEERDSYTHSLRMVQEEYERLKTGKVLELPSYILEYFQKEGIEFHYGMGWLKKNTTYSQEKKSELIQRNPMLPYSIIMSVEALKQLEQSDTKLYTNFPIPILIWEQLEQVLTKQEEGVLELSGIHFLVLFDKRLIQVEELEKLLLKKQKEEEKWQQKIIIKKQEIEQYRDYKHKLEEQNFTIKGYALLQNTIEETQKIISSMQEEYASYKEKRIQAVKKEEMSQKEYTKRQEAYRELQRKKEDFCVLQEEYHSYLSGRNEKRQLEEKRKEEEEKIKEQKQKIREAEQLLEYKREEKRSIIQEYQNLKKQMEPYLLYEQEEPGENLTDMVAVKARYQALTEEIALTLQELNQSLGRERERYAEKCRELERRNKYQFAKEEYENLYYSEEMTDTLEKEKENAKRQEDLAVEQNNKLERCIAELETKLKYERKHLKDTLHTEELVERKCITNLNFDGRMHVVLYEKEKKEQQVEKKQSHLSVCTQIQVTFEEYTEFSAAMPVDMPDVFEMQARELQVYQGELRRKLKDMQEQRDRLCRETERYMKEVAQKDIYKEEFFQKSLQNLIQLSDNVRSLKTQHEVLVASYRSMLDKLQVDLENVEKERNNAEELFLEYIEDVNHHMGQIDKNSSIKIRNKNLKMLRIKVPDWNTNASLYQEKLHLYVEQFIKRGIEAADSNENVEEVLGKWITTKRLYNEVVGTGNIEIRMYKVEEEREVAISWAEVSANSGGEGFLSAFVILTCLLSYMRRDETDLFASGEEGKVLIMDNPFAKTYSVHLLKPLMDMAKKTNTQLICLSGLGGDSIYDRFDNIYVLKLVPSNLRHDRKYMDAKHIKGEDIREMTLSEFRMEQRNLFELH